MVKNPDILQEFEYNLEQTINNSFEKRLQMYESMHVFKNTLIPNQNLLDGLSEKIELIRRLHCAKPII